MACIPGGKGSLKGKVKGMGKGGVSLLDSKLDAPLDEQPDLTGSMAMQIGQKGQGMEKEPKPKLDTPHEELEQAG